MDPIRYYDFYLPSRVTQNPPIHEYGWVEPMKTLLFVFTFAVLFILSVFQFNQ